MTSHPATSPPRFTIGRMFGLWVPLAFTFLLMSGSSPIVSAGINRLPGSKEALKEGLAVFCDAFRAVIFLHAPCFVVRDIAIRSIRDRRSYLRTLGFVLAVAAVCAALELVIALTPFGDLFLRHVVGTPEALVGATKRAVLPFAALPFLIGIRGIHQGVHIHGETTVWVGIGTAVRMTGLAVFALILSPSLGLEPAVMGALAFVIGLVLESIVNTVTALRRSTVLRRPGDADDGGNGALARFALPLMLANLLGVAFQPMVARISGLGGDAVTSKAALQILISWVWFFSSSLFAMQALVIAHARDRESLRVLIRFGTLVSVAFGALFLVTALIPPLRDFVLITLFKVEQADVHSFVTETLPLTVVFPVVVLARALLRGLIVRSGETHWTIWTTVVGLAVLIALQVTGLVGGVENGSFPAAWAWLLALLVEALLSGLALLRIGLGRVFREGRAELDA